MLLPESSPLHVDARKIMICLLGVTLVQCSHFDELAPRKKFRERKGMSRKLYLWLRRGSGKLLREIFNPTNFEKLVWERKNLVEKWLRKGGNTIQIRGNPCSDTK